MVAKFLDHNNRELKNNDGGDSILLVPTSFVHSTIYRYVCFQLLANHGYYTSVEYLKEERRPDGLPRSQALLGILCGNRCEGGHGKRV